MRVSASSPAAAVPVDRSSTVSPVETVPLVLEITRGRTRFRSRPVAGPRFLIGAGVTCDLRLGGTEIPVLHSIINVSGNEIHLEAVAPNPVLIVNGRGVREVELSDGDVIGIGDIELRARLTVHHSPAGIQAADVPAAVVEADDVSLADLSAAELIERIETEERMVEEFEEGRLNGARALTDTVFSRAAERSNTAPRKASARHGIPAPHFLSKRPQVLAARGRSGSAGNGAASGGDGVFLRELEQLGKQLTELSHEVQTSSQRSSVREQQYAEATELLMQTQDKLASQLETLVSHVSGMQEQPAPSKPRAIA